MGPGLRALPGGSAGRSRLPGWWRRPEARSVADEPQSVGDDGDRGFAGGISTIRREGRPPPENRQRRLRSCPGVCSDASPRAGHPLWPGITGLTLRGPAAAGVEVPGVLDMGRSQLAVDLLQAPQHIAGVRGRGDAAGAAGVNMAGPGVEAVIALRRALALLAS